MLRVLDHASAVRGDGSPGNVRTLVSLDRNLEKNTLTSSQAYLS